MNEKLEANVKYFKHLCEKENLLYEEIEKYTYPFEGIMYKVNSKINVDISAKIVILENYNKPLIYRLIYNYIKILENLNKESWDNI